MNRMKKILVLGLLCFAPLISAHTVSFSNGPQNSSVALELEDIQSLPATTYTTELPWSKGESEFTGVKLSTLLTHVYGDIPEEIDIGGLNNYHAIVRRPDIVKYQPILAYQKDQHYIKIRDKGPYWIVYPLHLYPELNRSAYHIQMVWQVNKIKLIKK